ncbi:MAG: hypothetical protein QM723_03880 [Myxococcaceae bacterium]
MIRTVLFVTTLALVACGGKKPPPPPVDGGMDDGGTDSGIPDAGRPRGMDPASGFTVALPLPDSTATTLRVGVSAALALDQYGQPMLACVNTDPNGDGAPDDNQVVFTRWNGVTKAYEPPVILSTVGDIDVADPSQQVSLARDSVSGTIYAAFVNQDKAVKVAYSLDEGKTWSQETASDNPGAHTLKNPQVAAHGDTVFVAYLEADSRCTGAGCSDIVWRSRTGSGSYSARATMPVPAGYDGATLTPYQLAVDSQGKAAIAAAFEQTAGLDVAIGFFRTEQTSSALVTTSGSTDNTATNDKPSVSLAFDGANVPSVAFHLLTPTANTQLWYATASASDGAVWGAPVAIPRNSAGAGMEGTRWYQSLAIDSNGKRVIGADHESSPTPQQCSGGPKIARSNDGNTWTVCRPDTGGATGTFGFAGEFIHAGFHAAGKATLLFNYENRSNPTIHAGVILWRDP